MSKPNLIAFSTAAGFFTNERVGNLREKVSETIKKTVPVSVVAPMFFQVLMAYAAWNQHDGDFSNYSPQRFWDIFTSNLVPITFEDSILIRKAFEETGLTYEGGKIRSWTKFNRHLAEYEKIKKGKIRAAKLMHKKRERDLKESTKAPASPSSNGANNGHAGHPAPASEPEKSKSKPKEASPTARLMAIKDKLENHAGAPNARNAPSNRDDLKLAQSEYRMLKRTMDQLNDEIAGVPTSKAQPQHASV